MNKKESIIGSGAGTCRTYHLIVYEFKKFCRTFQFLHIFFSKILISYLFCIIRFGKKSELFCGNIISAETKIIPGVFLAIFTNRFCTIWIRNDLAICNKKIHSRVLKYFK